jgi:LmbE family N-acetylglucosaminyl deacetylase
MSVWAHYDDDLIFANPALQQAMDAGDCIRTVFVTASDAGRGSAYSEKRELGILRAYNTMRGQQGLWSPTHVTLLSGAVLQQWSPDGDPDITVAFLRLPDGNMTGEGFAATAHTSLSKMRNGAIPALAPIDGGPQVSSETLVASLAETIQAYHATRLMTHVPSTAAAWTAGDHPDHAATGSYVRDAWQRAGLPSTQVSYAIGYPTASLPANLSGEVLSRKLAPYRVYASQDSVVTCETDQACLAKPKFGQWLQRNYLQTDAELFPAG